eukprot:SAG31_NODE_8773_length_1390_cov_1.314485_1_plen_167_part_10
MPSGQQQLTSVSANWSPSRSFGGSQDQNAGLPAQLHSSLEVGSSLNESAADGYRHLSAAYIPSMLSTQIGTSGNVNWPDIGGSLASELVALLAADESTYGTISTEPRAKSAGVSAWLSELRLLKAQLASGAISRSAYEQRKAGLLGRLRYLPSGADSSLPSLQYSGT